MALASDFATLTPAQLPEAADLLPTDRLLVSRGAGPLQSVNVQKAVDILEEGSGANAAAAEEARDEAQAAAAEAAASAAAAAAEEAVEGVDETVDAAMLVMNATLADVVSGVVAGNAVFAASYAVLNANNAPALNSFGIVPTDADLTKRGIYIETAAAGSPGWTLTTIPLASALVATLQLAIEAEVANRAAAFGGAKLQALPSDADYPGAITDTLDRMMIGFTKDLDVVIPRLLNFDTGDDRYGPDFLWGLVGHAFDLDGVEARQWWFYARRDGTCSIKIHPESFQAAEALTYLDPQVVIAMGARGQVSKVRYLGDGVYSYQSTQEGLTLTYQCKRNGSCHLIANEQRIEIRKRQGQSWESANMVETVSPFDVTGERHASLTFKSIFGGPLQYVGVVSQVPLIVDLTPLDRVGVSIGSVSAQSATRLRRYYNRQIRPILSYSSAYPGYRWDQLRPGSEPWTAMLGYDAAAIALIESYGMRPWFRWVGITESCAQSRVDTVDCSAALTTMMADNDATGVADPGDPLRYGIDFTPAVAEDTTPYDQSWQQIDFARRNANGRTYMVGPRNHHPLLDNIHYTQYGRAKHGEEHSLCETAVMDMGIDWEPLWVLKPDPDGPAEITVLGNTVTIQTNRPELTVGDLIIDTTYIEAAPNYGFRLKIAGSFRTITSVVMTGTQIQFVISGAPVVTGTVTEVSYMAYGPGSVAGAHSGVWGNARMMGPPSQIFVGEDIGFWLCAFKELVTAS